jgi:hypothetical protein
MPPARPKANKASAPPASALVQSRTHGLVCFAAMTLDYSRRPPRRYRKCQRHNSLPTPFGVERPHPRYEVNGDPSDGEEAVRKLLQGWMGAFPDLHLETVRLRHMDDGVLVEGLITGTHDGDWAGIPPTGRRVEVPAIEISSSTRTDSCARRSTWTWSRC